MTYSLDRIEGKVAVLVNENGESKILPADELEANIEGSMFSEINGRLVFDEELTRARRERLAKRAKNMFKKQGET
ncbi:MAG: DUF3006 domain-containing protein [Ruminococcus sp.]|nr:DUF3006 domain-containing protein [Ruminococcus sp.]